MMIKEDFFSKTLPSIRTGGQCVHCRYVRTLLQAAAVEPDVRRDALALARALQRWLPKLDLDAWVSEEAFLQLDRRK